MKKSYKLYLPFQSFFIKLKFNFLFIMDKSIKDTVFLIYLMMLHKIDFA